MIRRSPSEPFRRGCKIALQEPQYERRVLRFSLSPQRDEWGESRRKGLSASHAGFLGMVAIVAVDPANFGFID